MVPIFIILILIWLAVCARRQLLLTYWWQVKEFRTDRFKLFLSTNEGKSKTELYLLLAKVAIFPLTFIFPPLAIFYIVTLIYESYKLGSESYQRNLRRPLSAIRSNNVLLSSSVFVIFSVVVIIATASIQLTILLDILSYFFPLIGVIWTQIPYNNNLNKETKKAKEKLAKVKPKIIAITGSQGKSTTKHLIYHLLAQHFKVIETPLSHNTPFGVVRAINGSLKDDTEYFISEMGAYKKGEIKKLTRITLPDISIVTGISPQHIGLFGSMDNLISAKYEIAEDLGTSQPLFINVSSDGTKKILDKANEDKKLVITYALHKKADYYSEITSHKNNKTKFRFYGPKASYKLETNLQIDHLIENLTCAIAIADYLKVPAGKIKNAVKIIPMIERAITLKRVKDITIIDDSYNSTPQGFEAALRELNKFSAKHTLYVLTPGISELGNLEKKVHSDLARKMTKVSALFLTNPNLKSTFENSKIKEILTLEDSNFMHKLTEVTKDDKAVVLIEGRVPTNIYKLMTENDA